MSKLVLLGIKKVPNFSCQWLKSLPVHSSFRGRFLFMTHLVTSWPLKILIGDFFQATNGFFGCCQQIKKHLLKMKRDMINNKMVLGNELWILMVSSFAVFFAFDNRDENEILWELFYDLKFAYWALGWSLFLIFDSKLCWCKVASNSWDK